MAPYLDVVNAYRDDLGVVGKLRVSTFQQCGQIFLYLVILEMLWSCFDVMSKNIIVMSQQNEGVL